ncbi:hypothetical protein HA466_0032330 [Hirschfeldia incana]|nr:hypothetical protein HA466_0032330 [Hirschfeldia incana]
MMRFLGNRLAKSCGKGRLQCRDFSCVSEKGSLTTNSVSKQVQEVEEMEVSKRWDENEASLEARMKNI